jgi:hypothetical protein
MVAHTCDPSTEEAEAGEEDHKFKANLDYNTRPCLKRTTTTKRAGGVAEVVENLPSKCEAMGSNPVLKKKFFLIQIT